MPKSLGPPDDNNDLHFGRRLRHLRKQAEKTQEEVAKAAGFSRQWLATLEGRSTPTISVDALLKIQAFLGVPTIEEFLPGSFPSASYSARRFDRPDGPK